MVNKALAIAGLVLAIIGIICLAVWFAQKGENQTLLGAGLLCNSVSCVLNIISQRRRRKDE